MNKNNPALVIAAHGRHYVVMHGSEKLNCVTRGKKSEIAVGDKVFIKKTARGQAVIEKFAPRKTLLFRSDQYKSKLLAANVTQVFILVAPEPSFSDNFLTRALVATEAENITARIILNKTDLLQSLDKTLLRLKPYKSMGYPIHEVSAIAEPEKTKNVLFPLLNKNITVFIGQSGMGKSSLTNLLVPNAQAATREISTVLKSGKHTTTFSHLYPLNENAAVIDSPGFQEFGLYHLSEIQIARAFKDFLPYIDKCRFNNCKHLVEPDCAILKALKSNLISPIRHAIYAQIIHETAQKVY